MTNENREIENDVLEQRQGDVEKRQSVTERHLEKIGKHLFDSRRVDSPDVEPITFKGHPPVERPVAFSHPFTVRRVPVEDPSDDYLTVSEGRAFFWDGNEWFIDEMEITEGDTWTVSDVEGVYTAEYIYAQLTYSGGTWSWSLGHDTTNPQDTDNQGQRTWIIAKLETDGSIDQRINEDVYEGEGNREIDGSNSDAAGVDVSGVTDLVVGVYHLGNAFEKSTSLSGNTTYWLKIDLSAISGSPENACSIVTSDPSGGDTLAYKLLTVDGDGKALFYRGAWTEYDGSNIVLRFTQIIAPDVPLGTVRMWDLLTDVPIGWTELGRMQGYFPVGYDSGDDDYSSLGEHVGGFKAHGLAENNHVDHDLSHTHEFHGCFSIPQGENEAVSFFTYPDPLGNAPDVDEWTEDSGDYGVEPDDADDTVGHGGCFDLGGGAGCDTDNRPPYSPIRFIKREAI